MSPMFWVWALRPSSSCSPDALAPLHLRTHRAADDKSQRSRHCRVFFRQQLEARSRSAAGKKAIARPLTNFCRPRASRPDAIVPVRAWRPHGMGTLAPGGTPSAQTVTFSPITRNTLPAGIRYQRGAITEFGHLWTAPMIKAWSNFYEIHARCVGRLCGMLLQPKKGSTIRCRELLSKRSYHCSGWKITMRLTRMVATAGLKPARRTGCLDCEPIAAYITDWSVSHHFDVPCPTVKPRRARCKTAQPPEPLAAPRDLSVEWGVVHNPAR